MVTDASQLRGLVGGHAPGALDNGVRVHRSVETPQDVTWAREEGEIVGSVGPVRLRGREDYAYLVAWAGLPQIPVVVLGFRLAPVRRGPAP